MTRSLATSSLVVVLVLGLAVALGPAAHAADVALGGRIGTAGIGPEVAFGLGHAADLRLAAGFYSYDTTYDKTGIRYDSTLKLRNAIVTADLHPFLGGFRISLGGAWDDNRLEVSAPLRELVRRYRPDFLPLLPQQLGSISGVAQGNKFAPYGGIGWGHPLSSGHVSLSFDLGVLYHGEPTANLHANLPSSIVLPPAAQAILDAAVNAEEHRLEDELRDYKYLPVVAIGVMFRL